MVDPHNLIAFEDYPFSNDDWLGEGFHAITNPAHEGYGGDGVIWSTVAAKKKQGKVLTSKVGWIFTNQIHHFLLFIETSLQS